MGEHSQALGTDSLPVEALGRTYRLAPLGPKIRGDFEDWLLGRALASVEKRRAKTPPEVYRSLLAEIHGEAGAGEYDWGSDRFNQAINNDAGALELIRLLLLANHPAITTEEVTAAVEANRDGFLVALRQRLGVVPNSPAPDDGAKAS